MKGKLTMLIDLLNEWDTSFIGIIGEDIAFKYLHEQGLALVTKWFWGEEFLRLLRGRLKKELEERQIQYLENLARDSAKWSFDGLALKGFKTPVPYLVEIKASRVGKRKRGLKGNWAQRSRKGWTKEDILEAKQLGFKILLVNVQFLENWKFEVTSKEL